jgi:hypothetical protein
MGSTAQASGLAAVAVGFGAQASADGSVAIGWNSIANTPYTVSLGGNGVYRELVNVADPTTAHSAVTLGYLQSNYSTGDVIANLSQEIDSLTKQMTTLTTGSASTAAASSGASDQLARTSSMRSTSASSGNSSAPPQADSPVPVAPSTSTATADQSAVAQAKTYTDQQTQEAISSANTYAQAQDSQTLSAANAYTNQALSSYVTTDQLSQFESQVNAQFNEVDKRIDQNGAASAAWAGLAQNTSGDGANGIGVGFGSQGGQQAIAVGYKRTLGKHASFSFGGSTTGNQHSVSAGVGFNW